MKAPLLSGAGSCAANAQPAVASRSGKTIEQDASIVATEPLKWSLKWLRIAILDGECASLQ
jgi:hypothetical protein